MSGSSIEIEPYLTRLCEIQAGSMIGERRAITLEVHVQEGTATSSQAVSIGLIVTELVLNALKHAFPDNPSDGRVLVAYDVAGSNWRLTVSDNGVGRPDDSIPNHREPTSSKPWPSSSMPGWKAS